MNKKIFLTVFWVIVILGSLEIVIFFALSFFNTPDIVTKYNIGVPRQFPTFSDLFIPMELKGLIPLKDEEKNYYPDSLIRFSNTLESIMDSDSSFVKEAGAGYAIAGRVSQFGKLENGYEITLKNVYGEEYKENLNIAEIEKIEVHLRVVSDNTFSRRIMSVEDVRLGDYVVVRRTTDLLTPSKKQLIQIEIIRAEE